MASRVDPLWLLGMRLDVAGRTAKRVVRRAFDKVDPAGLTVEAATAFVEGEGGEEQPGPMSTLVDTVIDHILDAQFDALDAVSEYLSGLQSTPVLAPDEFLGQLGSQTVRQFAEGTPRTVAARIAGGMDAAEAWAASADYVSGAAAAEPHIVGRDATATVANNDPRFVGYARVARPDACDFCKMLASRGPVYTKDTALVTREGQPYHQRRPNGSGGVCRCRMVALPKGAPGQEFHVTYPKDPPPGTFAATAPLYRPGAQTPERAGTVTRQLEMLRRQVLAGRGTPWTSRRIEELQREAISLVGMPTRSADLAVAVRHLPGQHDQKTHGHGHGMSAPEPEDDYHGSHEAPGRDYGAPMHDPDMMMPDVVAHPEWYGSGDKKVNAEAAAAIRKAAAGGPTTKIKVYRAVPDDVDADINPGDWVTPSKTYAQIHGEGPLKGKYKLLEREALAGDLFTEGNSIAEWGWAPEKKNPTRSERSATALALGVAVRHLAGKHDQKTHGRKGAGESGGLPDGWAADEEGFTRTGTYQVQLSTGRGTITVEASVQNFWGGDPLSDPSLPIRFADEFTEIERQQIRDAVNRTAGHIDRLQRANPVDDLDVRITSGMPSRIGGRVPFGRGGVPLMEINANLYEGDQGVWKRCFENNSNVGLPDDVVGSIVTHEYGHVLQYQAASKEIPEWRASRGSEAVGLLSRETWQRAMDGFPGFRQGAYDQMSSYAKSSPVEAYAEAFAEWSLRDRRPMSPLAREIAELEGWQ